MTTAEHVHYATGAVQVTDSLLTVGTATYPLASISNFDVQETTPDVTAWLLGAVVGGLGCFIAFSFWRAGEGGLPHLLFSLGALVICLRQVVKERPVTYHLVLRTAGGDLAAISSYDATSVRAVAGALQRAVSAH